MTGDHAGFAFHQILYLLYILPGFGRDPNTLIAYFPVKGSQVFDLHQFIFIIGIYFIEQKDRLYPVSFGSNQEPVYKSGKSRRIVQGDQKKNLINIRSNNMRLF